MKRLVEDEWDSWIRPGSRVFIGGGSACPLTLAHSLCDHAARLRDIEILHALVVGDCPWLEPRFSDTFSVNILFSESGKRADNIDRTPCFSAEVPGLFLEGILPLDVALVQVSPPDAHGYCTLGTGVDLAAGACRAARTIIAQVNPGMPSTHGQSFLHCDNIDAFLEADQPLPEFVAPEPDPIAQTVGKYVSQLVPDGATIHVGLGTMLEAVLASLAGHRDLGVHTEVFTDAFIPLLESRAINNCVKTLHRCKSVAATCIGTRRLYDFVDDNPHVEFHPTEYVNSPAVIARNERMVSISGADTVDLSGQVVAEPPRPGLIGSVGSHADFFRGASMSQGGVPIIALRSLTADGRRSRIAPTLSSGSGVASSRGHVHYVVTEYGVATLRGRSMRERTLELIQVAHPDFRDELMRAAISRAWLPSYQRVSPRSISDLGELVAQRFELKGETYVLRPLQPSDIRRLQEFFYSHTQETIRMRYGYAVTRMPLERAYDLVNVNQQKDLALGVFEVQGPRQIIHAVGRYYVDDDGTGAEVAFVVRESKRRCGMASRLMQSLIDVARKRGLERLWGRVRKDNLPMIALFKRFGGQFVLEGDMKDSDRELRIPLVEDAAATALAQAEADTSRSVRRGVRKA